MKPFSYIFILLMALALACTSAPTRPNWEATVDDAYRAFVYACDTNDWFSEEINGMVVIWFEATPLDLIQLNDRTFQILCQRCYLWGDLEDWGGTYECRLRPMILRWFRGDPTDPENWTWSKVE